MTAVTVSSKFQLVFPKKDRYPMGRYLGQEVLIFSYKDRIELINIELIEQMRGFLKGMDINIARDED